MLFNQALAALALGLVTVDAFHPYKIEGGNGARRNTGTVVANAFKSNGNFNNHNSQNSLQRFALKKRATTKHAKKLEKRLNNYNIEKADPPTDTNSAAIDQDGTDFSYFSEVTFGSDPGETVYLLLDTGSSSLWVMGTKCTTTACKSHSTIGSTDSTSFKEGSDTFSIGYNTGQVEGSVVTDYVSFAGLNISMQFGVADTTSDDFDDYPMDGILGLGRDSTDSGLAVPTFMQMVKKDKSIKNNLFAMHLDRHADGNADGELTFGIDDTRYTGDINYIKTDNDIKDWKIPADDISVNGKSLGISGCDAIIDSGTTYMFIPPTAAKSIFEKIEGATLSSGGDIYHLPCDTTDTISLVFNKVSYAISPKDYVAKSKDGSYCYSHIIAQAATGDDTTWLLGDTFLKNVYTVYDMDNARIGFGTKTGSSGVSTSPSPSSSSSSSSATPASTVSPPTKATTAPSSGTSTAEVATTQSPDADQSSKKSGSSKATQTSSSSNEGDSKASLTKDKSSTATSTSTSTAVTGSSGTGDMPQALSDTQGVSAGNNLKSSLLAVVIVATFACML